MKVHGNRIKILILAVNKHYGITYFACLLSSLYKSGRCDLE